MVASKFKQMLQDENGVSPVIGVILMVAVTVVLGAVIGAFVFGIGDSLGQPAPNAQFDFDYTASANAGGGSLVVAHDGGDTITADNTGKLTIDGTDYTAFPYSAGDTITTVDTTGTSEVSVVWESVDGGTSSSLGTWEKP